MKNALFGRAVITKYRKLHKGFTSVAPRSQKAAEMNSRLGYQHNSNYNDGYYSRVFTMLEAFLMHSHLIFTEAPWCKSFPFYWQESKVSEQLGKWKGSMNFQSWIWTIPKSLFFPLYQKGWRSHPFDELLGKCIGILFTTRHTYISVPDSVLFRDWIQGFANSLQMSLWFSSTP